MRTLHVDLGREMRGGQYQALALIKALGSDSVLMARESSPLYREAANCGVQVLPATRSILQEAARSADLAHAHDARAHEWLALWAKVPFVVSRRVAFPVKRSCVSRWKYRQAAHYLAVSNFVANELHSAGVPVEKVTVVYDGVDVPPTTSRGGSILAIKSEDPGKGTAFLERTGLPIKWASNLLEDLQTASVFVYISDSEGLGSAALLAMAAGVPVVASNVGGLAEVIRHGETGYLTTNEPGEIAKAIQMGIEHRDTMAPLARKYVQEHFTTAQMVERTTAVYRKVLA